MIDDRSFLNFFEASPYTEVAFSLWKKQLNNYINNFLFNNFYSSLPFSSSIHTQKKLKIRVSRHLKDVQ